MVERPVGGPNPNPHVPERFRKCSGKVPDPVSEMTRAVVVPVSSDGETVGALALGASLEDSVDLVALVHPHVRRRAKQDLELGGYRLVATAVKDDYQLLRDYDVVMMLDPASLVIDSSVVGLLDCPGLVCAVYDGAYNEKRLVPIILRPRKCTRKLLTRVFENLASCEFWDPLDGNDRRDSRCRRLPERFAATPLYLLLNGGPTDPLRLVRAANIEPEFLRRRQASLAYLAFGPGRPWDWWAVMPLSSEWRHHRDLAFANLRQRPGYDHIEHLRDRASENFALARAIVLPWLFVAAFSFCRWSSKARKPRRIPDLVLRHLGLLLGTFGGFVAARGAPSYHTFFRPSKQLLYERSPSAGAFVFYSTFAAGFVASLPGLPLKRRQRPTDLLARARHRLVRVLGLLVVAAAPTVCWLAVPTLASTVVPLIVAIIGVPVVATLAFLDDPSSSEPPKPRTFLRPAALLHDDPHTGGLYSPPPAALASLAGPAVRRSPSLRNVTSSS